MGWFWIIREFSALRQNRITFCKKTFTIFWRQKIILEQNINENRSSSFQWIYRPMNCDLYRWRKATRTTCRWRWMWWRESTRRTATGCNVTLSSASRASSTRLLWQCCPSTKWPTVPTARDCCPAPTHPVYNHPQPHPLTHPQKLTTATTASQTTAP